MNKGANSLFDQGTYTALIIGMCGYYRTSGYLGKNSVIICILLESEV